MKHLKKYISLICAFCLVIGVFSGCGSEKTTESYDAASEMQNVESGVVAENDLFSMSWNEDRAAVIITSKADGKVWGTTPVDYLNENPNIEDYTGQEMINSALSVSCRNGEQTFEYYASTACIANGRFSSEKIENGIRVTFWFDEIEAVVSEDFYLDGESFKVSVDPNNIKYYSQNNKIISVTPAPFLCSGKNTKTGSGNYLVVPSGSGALMYTDSRTDSVTRTFTGNIYGDDYSVEKFEQQKNVTPVTMPFYGIKSGNSALCAIVESAAEQSEITARAGDFQTGYSNIYITYDVLGYNETFNGTTKHRMHYLDNIDTSVNKLVVGYYPLSGDNADYTGIAQRYRKYLTDNKKLEKSQDNSVLTVRLMGSYVEDDLLLGIPTKKDVSLTSYKEAQSILEELSTLTGGSLIADMYGYGAGGINQTKLAGDYKLTGAVGSAKDLKNFVSFTSDSSIKTFFNFNTVEFASSTKGYKIGKGSARNANELSAPVKQYWYNIRSRMLPSEGGLNKVLISRSLLKSATLKTVSLTDKYGITGLAFDELSNVMYSDYNKKNDKLYTNCNNMAEDVYSIMSEVRSNSKSVLADGAYAYAAAAADVITECPTISNQDFSIDRDVPLYQIVFQGTKANSVYSINLALDSQTQFLKAMETGSGLAFTLVANYNNELRKQYMRGLNRSLYSDNKDMISSYVAQSKDYLTKVAGATIKKHVLLNDDVVKTVFSNGVTVIVNYGDKDYNSELGTVKALSFITK